MGNHTLNIVQITDKKEKIDETEWLNFIQENPRGNIFHTPQMYDTYINTKHYTPIGVFALRNKKIVGLIIAIIQKEYSGLLGFFSSRSVIMGVPILKDDEREVLQHLLNKYLKVIKNKAIYSQIRNLNDTSNQKAIFKKYGFQFEDHLNIHISLPLTEEDYWNVIKSKTKNKIRKAFNNNIQFGLVKKREELEDVYSLLREVYDKIKLPLPDPSLFYAAWDILGQKHIKIFKATKDGRMIGCRLELLHGGRIYDWYAGSKQEYNKYNVNDFLPYKIICWAINNGYAIFDFGGAGHPSKPYGVRDHKMKFGGELVNFGRYNIIHAPLIYHFAKAGLYLWQFVKNMKIKLLNNK